jgi:hypothetical protein
MINKLQPSIQYNKIYYEMTTMSKWSLISESAVTIRIDEHPTREESDRHVVRMAPRVSCMTTVHKAHTKSKLGLCF